MFVRVCTCMYIYIYIYTISFAFSLHQDMAAASKMLIQVLHFLT